MLERGGCRPRAVALQWLKAASHAGGDEEMDAVGANLAGLNWVQGPLKEPRLRTPAQGSGSWQATSDVATIAPRAHSSGRIR